MTITETETCEHGMSLSLCAGPNHYPADDPFSDCGPAMNSFQTADAERHYLYAAGFAAYCGCSRCEWAAELAAEDAEREAEHDAMTAEELEEDAEWRFQRAERDRAVEFTPGPFDAPRSDGLPFADGIPF